MLAARQRSSLETDATPDSQPLYSHTFEVPYSSRLCSLYPVYLEMTTDSSSSKWRVLSDSSPQAVDTSYDLITFLAVIQKLHIGILSITWEEARQPIGRGATGEINEALFNIHTSFAFKCVSKRQKDSKSEGDIFSALINEVVALGHASIRQHPNIAELQGVCWEVTTNEQGIDKVWPVLVFEKTQYGDLYNFATLPVGRELGFAERLRLCVDVCTAVSDMHLSSTSSWSVYIRYKRLKVL